MQDEARTDNPIRNEPDNQNNDRAHKETDKKKQTEHKRTAQRITIVKSHEGDLQGTPLPCNTIFLLQTLDEVAILSIIVPRFYRNLMYQLIVMAITFHSKG